MIAAGTPFSLILFGASGHLAQQKLYPALYTLALKKRLPKEFAIIGFARSAMDDGSFRALVAEAVRRSMNEANEKILKGFLAHIHYHRGEYTAKEDFAALAKRLSTLEQRACSRIRLAYLSIPPTVFAPVLHGLCASRVHDRTHPGDFRCIVEKPVGHDLASFEDIEKALLTCFTKEEIFFLDHYLGKEAVRNIYYLRLANPVLERLLKNTLIHHVEITALEDDGIEGRAGYFDSIGTLRDMVQSHLLEIASLLTMRLQEKEEAFRDHRFRALDQWYLPPAAQLSDMILQGQYAGYTAEEGVAQHSRTNTFIACKLMTRASRWEGIPFYFRSGKRCGRKVTRIAIQFQETQRMSGGAPNRLDIILQGEAGMRLHLQTKLGGTEPAFRPLILEDPLVCVGDCLPEHGLLLLEAIHGKQQWFLSFDEVRSAWRLTDPLQAFCDQPSTALPLYPAGNAGPAEAAAWIARDAVQWLP